MNEESLANAKKAIASYEKSGGKFSTIPDDILDPVDYQEFDIAMLDDLSKINVELYQFIKPHYVVESKDRDNYFRYCIFNDELFCKINEIMTEKEEMA